MQKLVCAQQRTIIISNDLTPNQILNHRLNMRPCLVSSIQSLFILLIPLIVAYVGHCVKPGVIMQYNTVALYSTQGQWVTQHCAQIIREQVPLYVLIQLCSLWSVLLTIRKAAALLVDRRHCFFPLLHLNQELFALMWVKTMKGMTDPDESVFWCDSSSFQSTVHTAFPPDYDVPSREKYQWNMKI